MLNMLAIPSAGSGFTCLEFLKLCEKAESQWKAEAESNGYCVSNQTARQAYLDRSYPGKFVSSNVFNESKAAIHSFRRMELFDPIATMIGSFADFTDQTLKNEFAVHALHAVSTLLHSHFKGAFSDVMIRGVASELLKFCFPLGLGKDANGCEDNKNKSFLQTFVSTRNVSWLLNNRDVLKALLQHSHLHL